MQIYEEHFSFNIVGKSDVGGNVTSKRKNKNKEENLTNLKRITKEKKTVPLYVLENISNSTANHSKFQLGNKKPREISNEG